MLRELGIGFVAYSPLARGFLTGAAQKPEAMVKTDVRFMLPWWHAGNFERNTAIVQRLKEFAAEKGASVSQLALAWILAQGEHIVAIPGSRSALRVEENARSANVILSKSDLDYIGTIVPNFGNGDRAPSREQWE